MLFSKNIKKPVINIFAAAFIFCSTAVFTKNNACSDLYKEETIAGLVLVSGAAALCVGLACLKTHSAYQSAKEQFKALQEFHENPDMSYQNLKDLARNLYYRQSWFPSSTSLESDYPVIWLEKAATSNKNLLSIVSFVTFNEKLSTLSKNLSQKLNFLRNSKSFIAERAEYNEKLREQNYRESKLSIERQKLDLERNMLNRPVSSNQSNNTIVISVK